MNAAIKSSSSVLVLMNLDGTEGRKFDLQTDVTIGRDKACNVRIKLPSISRQHARINFDENGKVLLTHLSKTNPSFINGNRMDKIAVLSNGDLLAFGDQIFMFKQQSEVTSDTTLLQTSNRNNSPNRFLTEHNSLPFSPAVIKKGLPTPLRKKIESLRKTEEPSSSNSLKASVGKTSVKSEKNCEQRRILPTPLRKGIQARNVKSEDQQINPPLLSTLEKMKTPSKELPGLNQDKRILPTPLRQGILQKRKSLEPNAAEQTASKSGRKSAIKYSRNEESRTIPVPSKQINFNLQDAIVARKKTLRRVCDGDAAPTSNAENRTEEPQWKAFMKSLVPTPLRLAVAKRKAKIEQLELESKPYVDSRQKSCTPRPEVEKCLEQTSIIHSPLRDVQRQLFTPLKKEIVKRRKSLRASLSAPIAIDVKREEDVLSEQEEGSKFLSPIVEKAVLAITEALNSPEKTLRPVRVLATPLREAIRQKRKSFSFQKSSTETKPALNEGAETIIPAEQEAENDSIEGNEEQQSMIDDDDVQPKEQAETQSFALASETFVKDIITSYSLQLTTDVLESEGEVQDEFNETSSSQQRLITETIAEIILSPQMKPKQAIRQSELFSPITPTNARQQLHLLQSIEKKSTIQYAQRIQSMKSMTDREAFLSDLISHLSDLDMEIIDFYAQKLQNIASNRIVDEHDAFGIAMDAYIRGVELLLKVPEEVKISGPIEGFGLTSVKEKNGIDNHEDKVESFVKLAEDEDEEEESADTADEEEGEDERENEDSYCIDYSDVLQKLFLLPKDYLDANSDAIDEQLVEIYAEELSATAGVSSAVAYGIALDSYVSDPVQFRHYIGRLALPSYQTVCFQTMIDCKPPFEDIFQEKKRKDEKETTPTAMDVETENTETIKMIPEQCVMLTEESTDVITNMNSIETVIDASVVPAIADGEEQLIELDPSTPSRQQVVSKPSTPHTNTKASAKKASKSSNRKPKRSFEETSSANKDTPAREKETAPVSLSASKRTRLSSLEEEKKRQEEEEDVCFIEGLEIAIEDVISHAVARTSTVSRTSSSSVDIIEIPIHSFNESTSSDEREQNQLIDGDSSTSNTTPKVEESPITKSGEKRKRDSSLAEIKQENVGAINNSSTITPVDPLNNEISTKRKKRVAETAVNITQKIVTEKEGEVKIAPVSKATRRTAKAREVEGNVAPAIDEKKEEQSSSEKQNSEEIVYVGSTVKAEIVARKRGGRIGATKNAVPAEKIHEELESKECSVKKTRSTRVPVGKDSSTYPSEEAFAVEEVKVEPKRASRLKKADDSAIIVGKTEEKNTTKESATSTKAAKATKKKVEEEEEEVEEEALAILCDGCDGEFFVDEIGLTKIPKGKWFCEACVSKKKGSTINNGRKKK